MSQGWPYACYDKPVQKEKEILVYLNCCSIIYTNLLQYLNQQTSYIEEKPACKKIILKVLKVIYRYLSSTIMLMIMTQLAG